MPDVIKLVPEIPVEEKIQREIVEILEDAIAEARAGKFTALIVLAKHQDAHWTHDRSTIPDVAQAIGQIEVIKSKMIAQYVAGFTPASRPTLTED